jgi:hypothetical protein
MFFRTKNNRTLLDGCAVQPGLFTRIKVSHENVGVKPAFLTDSLARHFTRYSPCFCTERTGCPLGAACCSLLNRTWFIIINFPTCTFICPPFLFPYFMSSALGELDSSLLDSISLDSISLDSISLDSISLDSRLTQPKD